MTKPIVQFTDREQTLVKKAILTYARFIRVATLINGKRNLIRPIDFTLGELAKTISAKVGVSDEVLKEMVEVLRKNKKEVVALV